MQPDILVTAGAAALAPEGAALSDGGTGIAGAVVVATGAELERLAPGSLAGAVVVAVGDGDGAIRPFVRLPASAGRDAVAAAVAAAREAARLRSEVADLRRQVRIARGRQAELLRVAAALAGEHDLEVLLERILETACELGKADAGSLYLIEGEGEDRRLTFVLARNDSVAAPLQSVRVALDRRSVAGHVALSGETVTVADVRKLGDGVPYAFDASFDRATGYHTRSLLAAPMVTRSGEVIGVLQLLNHRLGEALPITSPSAADRAVGAFGEGEVALIRALASQAAVVIENSRLVVEIEQLFEGFVQASVTAIEQRDPSTSGHSQRVATASVALARALQQRGDAAGASLRIDGDGITQLRYAALLHDFGKVGVRETVLTKERKLLPDRRALIGERLRHARRAIEAEVLRAMVAELIDAGRSPDDADLRRIGAMIEAAAHDLQEADGVVDQADQPVTLEDATLVALRMLSEKFFPGPTGRPEPLISSDEVSSLAIRRGSLTEEELAEMRAHVDHSFRFLKALPWPRRLADVPAIAHAHHEAPGGNGYPRRLAGDAIPLEARIIAVCDVFDALVAADRPYKPALSVEEALETLRQEADAGLLDGRLVEVFIAARVWEGTDGVGAAAAVSEAEAVRS